jgi:hypothetical protein
LVAHKTPAFRLVGKNEETSCKSCRNGV